MWNSVEISHNFCASPSAGTREVPTKFSCQSRRRCICSTHLYFIFPLRIFSSPGALSGIGWISVIYSEATQGKTKGPTKNTNSEARRWNVLVARGNFEYHYFISTLLRHFEHSVASIHWPRFFALGIRNSSGQRNILLLTFTNSSWHTARCHASRNSYFRRLYFVVLRPMQPGTNATYFS